MLWCLISWFQSAHTEGRLLGASASGASSHPWFVPALIITGLCDESGQLWADWYQPLRKVGLSPFCACKQNVHFRWGRLEMHPDVFVLVWIKPVMAQHPRSKVTWAVPQLQIRIYNSVIWDVLFLEINIFSFFSIISITQKNYVAGPYSRKCYIVRLNSLAPANVTEIAALEAAVWKTTQLQELLKENEWEEIPYLVHWTL